MFIYACRCVVFRWWMFMNQPCYRICMPTKYICLIILSHKMCCDFHLLHTNGTHLSLFLFSSSDRRRCMYVCVPVSVFSTYSLMTMMDGTCSVYMQSNLSNQSHHKLNGLCIFPHILRIVAQRFQWTIFEKKKRFSFLQFFFKLMRRGQHSRNSLFLYRIDKLLSPHKDLIGLHFIHLFLLFCFFRFAFHSISCRPFSNLNAPHSSSTKEIRLTKKKRRKRNCEKTEMIVFLFRLHQKYFRRNGNVKKKIDSRHIRRGEEKPALVNGITIYKSCISIHSS